MNMRRFIILAVVVLLLIGLAGITSGIVIAKTGPFLPGSPFFPMQYFAEQIRVRFQSPAERQTEAYFLLVERRLEDLVQRTGTPHEADALLYLDKSIDQAIQSWSQLSLDSADQFRERLIFLLKASEIAINRLTLLPAQNPEMISSLLAKIITLQKLASDPLADPAILADVVLGASQSGVEAATKGEYDPTIDPLAVPFPPGSLASQHSFYPLVGVHAEIECTNCHTDGIYAGTANYCEACHADVQPKNHFTGDCAACHSAYAWDEVIFDHTLVNTSDCASCHLLDKPANHSGNQCVACHSTSAWQPASFDHRVAGATDCKSCHSSEKPANHFSGQCSACHSTNSWQGASFNHQAVGATDCKSCHAGDKPANHYNGQCSACHSTNSWQGASFSHAGLTDCQSCHSGDRPSNHFSGQCSACHSTNSWQGASFSHNGLTDCQSCHSGDRPANHFSGQCSACHSTNSWGGASFSHNGLTDCQSCHSGDRPANHYSGQCSACHSTNSWGGASFSHNGLTDCIGCHSGDKPANHYSGQCSACHSTNSFSVMPD